MAVITTGRKEPRFVSGQSTWINPITSRVDMMSLNLISVDIRTDQPVPNKEFININVDGVGMVKIDNRTQESLILAAQHFLHKTEAEMVSMAQQVLEGNMRELIGKMSLEELVVDRETFARNVEESTAGELKKMGLVIVNLTIQSFYDDNNVIKDLGIENISKIQKDAAIARALAEKEVAVNRSKADQEANDARIIAETIIAQKNNELEIKKARLKEEAERERARADIAYEIAKEEARKELETQKENAEIAKAEQQAIRMKQEVEVKKQILDADVREVASAEKFKAQQLAEAKAYEIERVAEATERKAKADREAGLAEAEVMLKQAEAQNILNEQALSMKLMEVLPDLVGALAKPLENVDSITMYGEGNVNGMMRDQMQSVETTLDFLKKATGIDVAQIISSSVSGNAQGAALGNALTETKASSTTTATGEVIEAKTTVSEENDD